MQEIRHRCIFDLTVLDQGGIQNNPSSSLPASIGFDALVLMHFAREEEADGWIDAGTSFVAPIQFWSF